MTVELTTLEKYNQLGDEDKSSLQSLFGHNPEMLLLTAEKQIALFEKTKKYTIAGAVFTTISVLAYSFGMPNSILGFIGGAFAFIFSVMLLGFVSLFFVEIVFLILSKCILEKIHHQKFRETIEKKWIDLKSRERAAIDQQHNAKYKVEFENSKNYQNDFDAIVNFFAQKDRTHLMPQSLIHFSTDELAKFVFEKTSTIIKQTNISEEKKKESIFYYRHITLYLQQIADDEIVEFEESLTRISNLTTDNNIQDSVKLDLMEEYARISTNPKLKVSRDERSNRKYFENFEQIFHSAG